MHFNERIESFTHLSNMKYEKLTQPAGLKRRLKIALGSSIGSAAHICSTIYIILSRESSTYHQYITSPLWPLGISYTRLHIAESLWNLLFFSFFNLFHRRRLSNRRKRCALQRMLVARFVYIIPINEFPGSKPKESNEMRQ